MGHFVLPGHLLERSVEPQRLHPYLPRERSTLQLNENEILKCKVQYYPFILNAHACSYTDPASSMLSRGNLALLSAAGFALTTIFVVHHSQNKERKVVSRLRREPTPARVITSPFRSRYAANAFRCRERSGASEAQGRERSTAQRPNIHAAMP